MKDGARMVMMVYLCVELTLGTGKPRLQVQGVEQDVGFEEKKEKERREDTIFPDPAPRFLSFKKFLYSYLCTSYDEPPPGIPGGFKVRTS